MSDLRKAAEMALEDICGAKLCEVNSMSSRAEMLRLMDKAAEALRQALAEQEPVAWVSNADFVEGQYVEGRKRRVWWECEKGVGIPLYTAPSKREWVGLTGVDIHEVVSKKWWDWEDAFDIEGFSYAIEAKLKEKNT